MALPARPLGEPVLDQPGLVARCVVLMSTWMSRSAGDGALHLGRGTRRNSRAPMPLHAAPDDRAGGGVEGGEQGGRAVALVIVAAPLRLARPHGQHRLGAVERLDLALLVDAEHQRAVRRVEIEADDVAHLVDELRVARQLEALDPVRLQAEGAPDTVHRRRGDARRPGHRAAAPVGRTVGHRLQPPRVTTSAILSSPILRGAPGRGSSSSPPQPPLGKAGTPQADGPSRDAQLLGDRQITQTVRRQKHDLRARRAAPCDDLRRRTRRSSSTRSRSLRTIATALPRAITASRSVIRGAKNHRTNTFGQ